MSKPITKARVADLRERIKRLPVFDTEEATLFREVRELLDDVEQGLPPADGSARQ